MPPPFADFAGSRYRPTGTTGTVRNVKHSVDVGSSVAEPLATLALDPATAATLAVFLDFDGTLVEIVERPDMVEISPETLAALTRLYRGLNGAVAVITGRAIGDVDRFLSPLKLPVAGVHGLERRLTGGEVRGAAVDSESLDAVTAGLQAFVAAAPSGLILEPKAGSIALHYRARPELEGDCVQAMDDAVHGVEGLHVLRGKMVIEARVDGTDKGGAVAEFLAEPPFAGRMPFFAGDDVTDEFAFDTVNKSQGISVKIGPGDTAARYRADSTDQFLRWLRALANEL